MKRFKSLKNYIYEANLAGRTVNYAQPTGAFYKYVQMSADPSQDYESDKDAKLLDMSGVATGAILKKGQKFKILDREEKDLELSGKSYTTKINYKGKEYRLPLNSILKPSGKKVDYIQVDLEDKINPDVWKPFKGGHGHEGQIANVFINGSGGNWEFEHRGKEYHITELSSPPTPKGIGGNPKTDLYVKLAEKLPGYGNELKYSLKADNATFIENWMKPERMEQIFGKSKTIRIIMEMHKRLNDGEIGERSPTMHWFVKDKKNNTGIMLDNDESTEAFSGANKFGKNHPATANCFLKGDPTRTISELIKKTYPIDKHGVKAGLHIRGYGQQTNSACFIKSEDGNWAVNSSWMKYFNLPSRFGN